MAFFSIFLKTLFVIIFVAGYMSILVLSRIMSEGRNPELGKAMEVASFVILIVLILGQALVEIRPFADER
ncbi:hypothetical protein, partial [Arthrobacter oryzae]